MDDETKRAFADLTNEMRAGFAALTAGLAKTDAGLDYVTSEMTAGFARVYGRFDQVSEDLGRLGDKVVALTEFDVELSTRFLRVEMEVREVRARIDRLAKDLTLGKTAEADRYRQIQERLAATEKATSPRA